MAADEYNRRRFLKDSVWSFARTAHEFVKHRDAPKETTGPAPVRSDWLRPPGAVEESLFMERCTRCGDCITACSYGSIKPNPQDGFPVIFADQSPCWLCEDLPCIEACETEALLLLNDVSDVRMGRARVSPQTCTAGQGCNACVSRCPVQALSMDFDALQVEVDARRCVGCGLCEQTCKTVNDRAAVRVVPARLLQDGGRPS